MKEEISIYKAFTPLTGSDDKLLFDNPDRGFRTEYCLLIKEKFPDSVYLREGLSFKTVEEAENHKIKMGPGYAFYPVSGEDGETSHYVVKFIEISRSVFCDKDSEYNKTVIRNLFKMYLRLDNCYNYRFDPSHLVLAYLYITDFIGRELSDSVIECIKQYFEVCREMKLKNMLRICYNWEYLLSHTDSERNRRLLSSQCADQETIMLHTKQLGAVIGVYKDTVHTISTGFVGYVGEWAWHYQYPEVDYNKVTKAILENICAPNGIYYSCRLPEYRYNFMKAYPNHEFLYLLGLNNDAIFGEQEYETLYTYPDGRTALNRWNSADYGYNIRDEKYGIIWWDHTTDTAYKTPQDGEMFVQQNMTATNRCPHGYDVMKECAHHRHTAMSYWHGYLDTNEMEPYIETNIMTSWQNPDDKTGHYAPVDIGMLKELGIIYDPSWLVDDEGNEIADRNAYNFIRDHLGYRICLQSLSVTAHNNTAEICLKLKNYGFAAAFNLSSRFVLLNGDFDEVASVKAGEPSQWISLPADFYANGNYKVEGDIQDSVLIHKITAQIALPKESGKYFIALILENGHSDSARVSNKLDFINGYNILTEVNL